MAGKPENYPIIPHQFAGAYDCCDCLVTEFEGDQFRLVCNECGVLVRTITRQQFEGGYVPEDLQLKEIESALRRHRCHAEPPRLSNTPQHALAA
jgi:hypothetical protein